MSWQENSAPEGWTLRKLGEVAKIVGGGTPKTSVQSNFSDSKGHPWITPADLTGYRETYVRKGRRFLTDKGLASSSAKYVPAGSVLFSTRAPIGYVAIAANPLTTNQGFRSFVPTDSLDPEYLYHALRFLRPVARQHASGTTFPELSGSNAAKMQIAFPSRDQQRAIAVLLNETDRLVRSAATHLKGAEHSVRRFRHGVLAAACSGRLSVGWRAVNNNEESAHELNANELPAGWRQAALSEVASVQVGGTPARATPGFWGGDIRWVSSGEVANCRIATTRESITEAGLQGSNAKRYPAGTVLIAMIGEGKTRGQAAILDIEACTNQNVAGLIPDHEVLDPEYLWRWALAKYEATRMAGRGGNQPALNKRKVQDLVIQMPPLAEQQAIVRRVDELLGATSQLSARIERAATLIDNIQESAASKAFRGV